MTRGSVGFDTSGIFHTSQLWAEMLKVSDTKMNKYRTKLKKSLSAGPTTCKENSQVLTSFTVDVLMTLQWFGFCY